jgi:hypothetical protein
LRSGTSSFAHDLATILKSSLGNELVLDKSPRERVVL